jgi:hypothetical protein
MALDTLLPVPCLLGRYAVPPMASWRGADNARVMSLLSRLRPRKSRIANLRSSMLGDIAYAQAGRTEAYFSLARSYLDLAGLSRRHSPACGTFIGLAAGALLRYLVAPDAPSFADSGHSAALMQRVLAAHADFDRPRYARDPLETLREVGTPWVEHVCDPSALVQMTVAIES